MLRICEAMNGDCNRQGGAGARRSFENWNCYGANIQDVFLVVQCVTTRPDQLEISQQVRQRSDSVLGSPCELAVYRPNPFQLCFRTKGEESFSGSARVNMTGDTDPEVRHTDRLAALLNGDHSYGCHHAKQKDGHSHRWPRPRASKDSVTDARGRQSCSNRELSSRILPEASL